MKPIKISLAAHQLGVSVKTLYNWIKNGELEMVEPGFVLADEARNAFERMKAHRVEISYFMAYGIKRDSKGRFFFESEEN